MIVMPREKRVLFPVRRRNSAGKYPNFSAMPPEDALLPKQRWPIYIFIIFFNLEFIIYLFLGSLKSAGPALNYYILFGSWGLTKKWQIKFFICNINDFNESI